MKVVILAGGLGSRLSEETGLKPKAMVEIGGRPILWHILKYYSHFGFNDFVVALGYKAEAIKEYFLSYHALNNDFQVNLRDGSISYLGQRARTDWNVTLVETGATTNTGGRLKRLKPYLSETFMMTYCDGLIDVDLKQVVQFHRDHKKRCTVTSVRPPSRFGGIVFNGSAVSQFTEKPLQGEGWINGGYFVMEPSVIEYIESDETIWERQPLENLCRDGELMGFKHNGFFQPMDTLREKKSLDALWEQKNAPWKAWED